MPRWVLKNKLSIIGIIFGAIAGFMYWKFVGCASGTCMITSKPINSTLKELPRAIVTGKQIGRAHV